jgi:hypothetical protein
MASERELRTFQEQMLHKYLMMLKYIESDDIDSLGDYINYLSEEVQSGMTNDEVDAVRARVARSRFPIKRK